MASLSSPKHDTNEQGKEQDEIRRKEEKPVLSQAEAIEFCEATYSSLGKIVKIKDLDGYDDTNFWITTKTKDEEQQGTCSMYTLKFMNGVETDNLPIVEAQNATLLCLREHDIPAPCPMQTTNNELIAFITLPLRHDASKKRKFAVRVLTWVDGAPMNTIAISMDLLEQEGRFLGKMTKALENFDHPGAHRWHQWDLTNSEAALAFIGHVKDEYAGETFPGIQDVVRNVLVYFAEQIKPKFMKAIADASSEEAQTFPQQILQGDFNDNNVIANQEGTTVIGVIDFGDLIYSFRVNEIAIAIAYATLTKTGRQNLLQTVAQVFKGYISQGVTLTKEEMQILAPLICCRLATSICMGTYTYAQNPDPYILVHSLPAHSVLLELTNTGYDVIQKHLQVVVDDVHAA